MRHALWWIREFWRLNDLTTFVVLMGWVFVACGAFLWLLVALGVHLTK